MLKLPVQQTASTQVISLYCLIINKRCSALGTILALLRFDLVPTSTGKPVMYHSSSSSLYEHFGSYIGHIQFDSIDWDFQHGKSLTQCGLQ